MQVLPWPLLSKASLSSSIAITQDAKTVEPILYATYCDYYFSSSPITICLSSRMTQQIFKLWCKDLQLFNGISSGLKIARPEGEVLFLFFYNNISLKSKSPTNL